jgi:tetratricopeptide (TPR) repeat protein
LGTLPDLERVVEVLVPPRGDRDWGIGSGYEIADGLILTARHVLGDAETARVRFRGGRAGECELQGKLEWPPSETGSQSGEDERLDLALLRVHKAGDMPHADVPDVGEPEQVVGRIPFCAVGFPRFKRRIRRDRPPLRETQQVDGTIPLGTNVKSRQLALETRAYPPRPPEPDADGGRRPSPWEGMSGAAVFSGACLVGVITVHRIAESDATLTAVRISAVEDPELVSPDDRAAFWAAVGLEPDAVAIRALGPRIYDDLPYYPIALRAPLRRVFDPLIEERARLFAGRGDEERLVVEFISRPQGGYLAITGAAGFGKTALVANLIGDDPHAFAYHFFSPLYGDATLSEGFYLRNVVEQLAEWHGRTEALPAESQLNELRAAYHELVAEPLDRTQILILDGLDEVRGWTLRPYLMRRLPQHLHFVATIRDVGQDWRAEYGFPVDQVEELKLEGLSRAGVAEVFERAGDSAAALADRPAIVDEIVRVASRSGEAAEGADPFYVRLLAEDAAEGVLTVETLSQRPSGLEAYLDQWWHEVKEAGTEPLVRELFGILTVALGPMEQSELEALVPELSDDWGDSFEDVAGRARRLLIRTELGWALAHPLLAEHLSERIRTERYLKRVVEYCSRWTEHRSAYAFAHYAEHLRDAGSVDSLLALPDLEWMQGHRESERSLAGFARDVELALSCADSGQPPVLAQEIRLCFVAATVAAVSTSAPPAAIAVLAQVGRVDEAQAYAGLAKGRARQRSAAHRHLARGLLRLGDRDAACAALGRAIDALASEEFQTDVQEEYVYTGQEVSALAGALAEVGDETALERLLSLTDGLGHLAATARASVALGFAQAGMSERAAVIADELLANVCAGSLLDAHAATCADHYVEIASSPEVVLAGIAGALAAAGEVRRAQALADEALAAAGEGDRHVTILGAWARALADGPLRPRALVAARAALAAAGPGKVPEDAAEALSAVGDAQTLEEAYAVLSQGRPDSVSAPLVTALARVGSCDRALEALDLLPDWSRGEPTGELAAALAAASRVEEAFELAEAAARGWPRTETLAAIAEQLANVGRLQESEAYADRAIREGERLDDEPERASALGTAAVALLDAGATERARAVTERARDLQHGPDDPFLEALVRLGYGEDALGLDHPNVDVTNLSAVGQAAHEAGREELLHQVEERLRALARGASSLDRINALIALGDILAATGRRSEAVLELRRAVDAALALKEEDVDFFVLPSRAAGAPLALAAAAEALGRADGRGDAVRAACLARDLGPQRPHTVLEQARAVALHAAGLNEDAVRAARRALQACENDPHPWYDHPVEALTIVPADEAIAWVERMTERARQAPAGSEIYAPLSKLAVDWHRLGRSGEALESLRAAFRAARLAGHRNRFLEVLRRGAPILTGIDHTETLWAVSMAVVEVGAWWE